MPAQPAGRLLTPAASHLLLALYCLPGSLLISYVYKVCNSNNSGSTTVLCQQRLQPAGAGQAQADCNMQRTASLALVGLAASVRKSAAGHEARLGRAGTCRLPAPRACNGCRARGGRRAHTARACRFAQGEGRWWEVGMAWLAEQFAVHGLPVAAVLHALVCAARSCLCCMPLFAQRRCCPALCLKAGSAAGWHLAGASWRGTHSPDV